MDTISYMLGYKKGLASAGSGKADSIYTVTFMSEDGETVLYQRSVVDGDNCADVVTRGLLAKPTKESTAQYNYTYSGWSLTAGGAASTSALSAVTEDRTVYAAFTASTRYYTVRFYDGETLLKTASVAYGGSYTYTYTKEGYLFEGWNPEPTNVTSDMDCYGVWVEKPNFANSSWADIARICESGKAAETFALGDTRSIKLTMPNGSLWVQFQIVGFNHDDLADGSGKAGISVVSVPTMYRTKLYEYDTNLGTDMLNDVCFTRGCWDTSALRTLCGTYIYSYLPSDLQACIKEVTKKFYNASRELSEIGDKVWIPSAYEITEPTGYTCGADGTRYAYFDTAVKRAKKKLDGTAAGYGTRSPSTYNNGFNAGINQGGSFYAQSAYNGYCPVGFCI